MNQKKISKNEKKEIQERVSKFVEQNEGLTNSELINKATQIKKSGQKSQSQNKLKINIPQPPQQTNKILKNDNIINNNTNNSQIETEKSQLSQNEKQLQIKLKEKQRDIQLLNDKIKQQEQELLNQSQIIKQLKQLIDESIKNQSQNKYNERRFLAFSYQVINQQQQIFRMTQIVQQTRQLQYEIENQLISLKDNISKDIEQENGFKIETFCLKQLERLRYIQSQQLHENEIIHEQQKNNQKIILQELLKIDSCLYNIINLFDQYRIQYNFIDDELITQLDSLSIKLSQFIQLKELPKMIIKPTMILVQESFRRIQGNFNKIFPHYNNVQELIKNQLVNDRIFNEMNDITQNSKQLTNSLTIRSINILRSLLIHSLISIQTFNFRPTFKPFFDIIKPFLEDNMQIINQYQNNNQQMGKEIIWELWIQKINNIQDGINLINNEMNQLKQEYQGYWNNKIFEQQQ